MMLRLASLTVLLLVTVPQGKGERRSLSEIRYHFTACGKTGRMGPSYRDCVDYYTSISSPIIRDNVLTDTYNSIFIGSQSFRAPRATVYNVTIAGAAGGRGLCNSEYGRGLVQYTSFTPPNTTFALLILVGQRGLGPCDIGELHIEHMLCKNPPQDLEESTNCSEAYHQWLQTLNGRDTDTLLIFSGGAGGGGASFIEIRDSQSFADNFVLGISGGGGGSSSLLDYSVIRDLLPQLNMSSEKDSVLYTEQLDARPSRRDTLLNHPEGVRGYKVESDIVTAGAGGGFSGSADNLTSPEDGKTIGLAEDFAFGGTNCARSDLLGIPLQLREADGGFGGGGGGCGGGGGGGGYTGGAILGDTNTVPGGGGHSFNGDTESCNVFTDSYTYNTEGDGYVDIVAADCGCVHECVLYEEEDQFECLCPKNTHLAPDLSDCYYTEERVAKTTNFRTVDKNEIIYRGVSFGNSTFILSVSVDLNTTGAQKPTSEGDRCVLMFFGFNYSIVLATNPVIGSHTATTLSEVSFDLTSGTLTMTDYTSFLNSSILVTGAILASTGECVIGDMAFFNVSIRRTTGEPANPSFLQPPNSSIASRLLQFPMESVTPQMPTDGPSPKQTTLIPIIVSVSVVMLFLAVLFVTLIGVRVTMRSKDLKKDVVSATNVFSELNDNITYGSPELNLMRQNAAYGVASYEGPYHIYESIPDILREYKDPSLSNGESPQLVQPPTNDHENEQMDHDVEDSI